MPKTKKMGKAKKAAQARMQPETVGVETDADRKAIAEAGEASPLGGMWKGQAVGDTLVGDVLVMKEEKSRFKKGEKQTVLTVGTKDGTVVVFCNVSLKRAIEAQQVKVNDRIAIQYKGTQSVGKGRPMNVYVCRKVLAGKAGRK